MNKVDTEYFRIVNDILTNGRLKKNRTGVDTIGIFGAQAKYNVDLNAFPLLTTKKVHWPAIVHELLWFISGDTNIKYLVDNNVRIWNEWAFSRYQKVKPRLGGLMLADELLLSNQEKRVLASKLEPEDFDVVDSIKKSIQEKQNKFIDRIKNDVEFAKEWGELGEGTYGRMWRDFPFFTIVDKTDPSTMPKFKSLGTKGTYCGDEPLTFLGRIDQITKVLEKLKNNPDDRRMIVSAWHPHWVDHCALPPCHCLFHFHTEELTLEERVDILQKQVGPVNLPKSDVWIIQKLNEDNIPTRRLNCLLYQRSCDFPIGIPFNIASYSLLTAMIAHVSNMIPGTFIHTYGDAHIYVNQLDAIKEQLTREPRPLPKVWLNPEVKSLFDFKYEDIKLLDYDPHPAIKMPVAV
jgi:thymidylate synthase